MRIAFSVVAIVLLGAAPAYSQPVNTVRDAIERIQAAPQAGPSPPMPASDPGTWVRTEDYPDWAAAYEVTGTVAVTLDVDAGGTVTQCAIRESSGVADLDRLACEKILQRAQFRPARDAQGSPVPGQWQSRVRWALPETGREAIPEPGELVVSMVVEPDGSVSKCVVERAEGLAARQAEAVLCEGSGPFQPLLDADGNPERRRIRLLTTIEHQPLP